jgi:hypothetical protein
VVVALILVPVAVSLALSWIRGAPERVHPPLTEAQLRGLTPDQRLQRQQEQGKLQNEVRTALLQGLVQGTVGLLALTGAAIGASIAWRQHQETRRHQLSNEELTREGQITDRFTRAVDQLGSDQLDVTLGGIYALERIAKDSPIDRATIAEILTAHVRGFAPWPPPEGDGEYADTYPLDRLPRLAERSSDVQAALTALGRMPSGDRGRLDVRWTDLRRADLAGGCFAGAHFDGAHLEEADLFGAHLERAMLGRV